MQHTLRREHHLLQIGRSVLSEVVPFRDFTCLLGTHFRHRKLVELLRAPERLKSAPEVLLDTLKRALRQNKHIMFLTRLLTGATTSVTFWSTVVATVAVKLTRYCAFAYGVLPYIPIHTENQLMA